MNQTEGLKSAIVKYLHSEIANIVEEEAKSAAKRVEERIRARTGEIAAKILTRYSMESFGQKFVISVDFDNTIT